MKTNIEKAQFVLKRNTEWIQNCDSKATTVLAFVGVLITVVCSKDSFLFLKAAILLIVESCSVKLLFLVAFIMACTIFCYGIYEIVNVLFACVDAEKFKQKDLVIDSKIFFGSIGNNDEYSVFYDKFCSKDDEDFLKDLLSQIYITSIIANTKYLHYNSGLKFLILSFIMLVVETVIFSILYM